MDTARPQSNQSIFLVSCNALSAFPHEGKKVRFWLGKEFVTWDMADSMWAGFVAVTLDGPSSAYFQVLIPVRTFLGALRSEVLVPHLSPHHFELVELIAVSYSGVGKLLVDDPLLSKFILFRTAFAVATAGGVFIINLAWVAFDFFEGRPVNVMLN